MMNADRLRKEAARARREGRPVRLTPADVEAIADELERLAPPRIVATDEGRRALAEYDALEAEAEALILNATEAVSEAVSAFADCLAHGDFDNRCRACGVKCETVFCGDCADDLAAACPHGNPADDCAACDVAGDLAFDSLREDALGGRR